MKILHIIGSFEQGGAETYTLRYCQYDKENRHYVLGVNGKPGDLSKEFAEHATVIDNIKVGPMGQNWKWFFHFLKKEKIDSVWSVNGGLLLLVAKVAGVGTRLTFYRNSTTHIEHDPMHLRAMYLRMTYLLNPLISTNVLSNSFAAIRNYNPFLAKRKKGYEVIYNGIDLNHISKKGKEQVREELGLPKNAFVIGHSGRYHFAKNHEMIMKVAFALCKKFEDVYFVLIGKGVPEKYGIQVEKEGLSQRIVMLGYRKDVMDILKALDLFYFPSTTEGQPNALIEAMLSGVPFVASDISAIKETTPDDLHRQLVSCHDFEKNYDLIECLYHNKEKLIDLKCESWAKSHFDANKQFELFKKQLQNE